MQTRSRATKPTQPKAAKATQDGEVPEQAPNANPLKELRFQKTAKKAVGTHMNREGRKMS